MSENKIIINGTEHVLVKDKVSTPVCNRKSCSLFFECVTRERINNFCFTLFGDGESHFEKSETDEEE